MDDADQPASTAASAAGRSWRAPGGLEWRRDLALPAVLLVLQLAGAAALNAGQRGHPAHLGAADWVLLVAGPLALTLRRRHPVAVLWVAFAATLAPSGAWTANLSLITAFFVAAAGGHRRAAWLVILAGYACSVWLAPLAYGNPVASAPFALLLLGWLAGLVLAAEVIRLARERSAGASAARQLDARRRASEERLRMARDLHDVIGHNISLINVQAGVGLDLWDSQPEQARAALTAIRAVSKDALGELRTMLAALRQADEAGEAAPRTPAPGLDRLPELLAMTTAAGLRVRSEIAGEPGPLPAVVDLAAYRIIQESLTNVARHAGPASARVCLTYAPDGLGIEVTDNGRMAAGGPAAAVSGLALPGAGTGIAGMRERAAAVGGRLEAGPRPGGGFAVTARLPLRGQP
jgi:signal transduction histidine kinase